MKVVTDLDKLLVISLSRKNLEGLLDQLDDCDSSEHEPCQVMRRQQPNEPAPGTLVIVQAQENPAHYKERMSGSSHHSQTYAESHGLPGQDA